MVRVLITGSREASPAMLAKVEDVVLWVKRQGHTLLVGDAPGVDAHVRVCAHHGLRRVRAAAGSASQSRAGGRGA